MPNHVTNINTFKGVSEEQPEEQPEEQIKVVLVKPMQKPKIVEIGTSLETMQETVGGLMYKQKADKVTKMCDDLMAVCIPRRA